MLAIFFIWGTLFRCKRRMIGILNKTIDVIKDYIFQVVYELLWVCIHSISRNYHYNKNHGSTKINECLFTITFLLSLHSFLCKKSSNFLRTRFCFSFHTLDMFQKIMHHIFPWIEILQIKIMSDYKIFLYETFFGIKLVTVENIYFYHNDTHRHKTQISKKWFVLIHSRIIKDFL